MTRVRFADGEDHLEFEDSEGKRHSVARGEAVDVPADTAKQLIAQGWEKASQSLPGAKSEEKD